MTSDNQINKILEGVKEFRGVYLYDELEKIQFLGNEVIIINYVTSREVEQGKIGHFVVLDNRRYQIKLYGWINAAFFDPYGLNPDEPRDIMGLENTRAISRLIERTHLNVRVNSTDWQVRAPWDDLCGVYCILYVKNPNFLTNPLFNLHKNRYAVDQRLLTLFSERGLVELVAGGRNESI